MKDVEGRIDEILDNYLEIDKGSSNYGAAVIHFKKITKQALLELMKGAVPEEDNWEVKPSGEPYQLGYKSGFNNCRAQTLKNLGVE